MCLKIIKAPKILCLWGLYLSKFTCIRNLDVNINNLWKITFPKQKNYMRRVTLFIFVYMSSIHRRWLDCYTCFCILSVMIYCLGKNWWECPASHKYVGKERVNIIAFLHNCVYSILILYQYSTGDHFLMASCCMVPAPWTLLCEPLPTCGSDGCFLF